MGNDIRDFTNAWTNPTTGEVRYYLNDWIEPAGLIVNRYGTGNVSSASWAGGEKLSNSAAKKILGNVSKIWFSDGEFHVKAWKNDANVARIVDNLNKFFGIDARINTNAGDRKMTTMPQVEARYTGDRYTWNNGFRSRWLAVGQQHADVINAARRGDLDAVLAHVKELGGVRGGVGIARSLIREAQSLPEDVPGHKATRSEDGGIMVYIPRAGWEFRGRRQIGVITWTPMFGTRGRS